MITTASEIIAVLIAEADVAVHPELQLREGLVDGGVCVVPIDELKAIAGRSIAQPMPARRRKPRLPLAVADVARVQRSSAPVGLLRIRLVPIVPDPLQPLLSQRT